MEKQSKGNSASADYTVTAIKFSNHHHQKQDRMDNDDFSLYLQPFCQHIFGLGVLQCFG